MDNIIFYVINLDRAADRWERFQKDFEHFPIPYIRIPAIDGRSLPIPPFSEYNAFTFFVHVGREARAGEVGCYFSHVKALKMFIDSGKEFALICEDDAMQIPESYEAIKQALAHSHTWDMLRLFGGRAKTSYPYQTLTANHHLCTSITGMVPAAAYIVNQKAAIKLVQKLLPMTDLYDSALHHGRVGIREATVFPNCILRNEHSEQSTIEGAHKRKLKPWYLIYWTSRLFKLRVRIVRYGLQCWRVWCRGKKGVRGER